MFGGHQLSQMPQMLACRHALPLHLKEMKRHVRENALNPEVHTVASRVVVMFYMMILVLVLLLMHAHALQTWFSFACILLSI